MPLGDDMMDDNLDEVYVNSNETIKNKNVMPQNLEAEQSLIGSILFDNKIFAKILISWTQIFLFRYCFRILLRWCSA